MTAEWKASEALELQKAIERGDRSASSMEFQEDVLHEPLDDLNLPPEMSVETVWAEKEEIAPLGAAAQAMIDDVVRRSLSESSSSSLSGGKRKDDASFLTNRRIHLNRAGSAPPRSSDGWPFAKRRREGEDYQKLVCLRRRTSYDDLDISKDSSSSLALDSWSSVLSEKIKENHSLLALSTESHKRYGEDWPLRATTYFHAPEGVLRPLNVFYERNRINKEKKKKASLSFTVSLADVPKVVVLDDLAEKIDSPTKDENGGFIIDAVDESLLAAVDQGRGGAAEEEGKKKDGSAGRLLFRSTSLPSIFLGGGRGEERAVEMYESRQVFEALLLQGSIQLDGVGVLARRTAESFKSKRRKKPPPSPRVCSTAS